MTGEGTVVKINGNRATVRIEKKSACSGECSSCGLCENPVYDIEAKNSANADVGDKVVLYMPTGRVYFAAFLVYMLPIIAILAVMGICYLLSAPTYMTAVLCIIILAFWIYIIRAYNKKANLDSEIKEIVKENP